MRLILASALLMSTAALGQQQRLEPPELFSPTLAQAWQVQPSSWTFEQQTQLAMKWAEQPTGVEARSFDPTPRNERRSTVGQGGQE
jgi:hypothetical protein